MATRIKLKRSLTPNSAPTTSDLQDKEVALNITDRTLFVNNNGTIQEVLNADPNDETIVPSMFSSAITNGLGNTWYVSENGTDKATLGSVNPRHGSTTGSNSWGKTPMTAFASLKYCLDNYATDGDTVIIASGTYTETFPLTVPLGISIKGAGFKTTFIKPTAGTNNKDAFLIQGNCNIEDIAVTDFYYDSVNNTGYAFRTKSGYNVTTSGRRPYVQRCSVITKGSVTSGSDPRGYAQGDAGRGVLIDGGVVATTSAEASILFNECTFIVPNSVGLYLKNGARCEWLNSFTYFAADSVIGENPGGSGFAGQGRTRLKLNGISGTFAAGNTITQYAADGTTVLASGTINQNDGTYIYLTGQGTGNFVEAIQSTLTAKQVTVNGDAQIDTSIKKIGNSSLKLDGTGDYLSLASSSDFGYNTGNFTIEFWVRRNSTGNQIIVDQRTALDLNKPVVHIEGGVFKYFAYGANRVTGTTSVAIDTWYHVAVVKNNNSTKLYVNGSQEGSAYTDNNDYGSSSQVVIGARFSGTDALPGYLDELRISKGIARYTSNFTAPVTAFTTDINTSLLLQFEGLDGSTDIIDGGIASQDIRTSAGGTANFVTLADYTAFGAELRSIGSASIYGERGLTATGKGVRLYCVTHNFSYIGTGKNQDNDISQVNQSNEVIESNYGRVFFTSVDQNGDFRVGNTFFVDQEKGTVSFSGGSSGTGTTFDQLIVSGTGNTTTILPTSINVGNLQFSGDTIDNITSNGIELGTTLEILDGSSITPSVAFKNDIDTGIFRDLDFAGNPLAFSYSGARKLQIGSELYAVTNLNISTSAISQFTVTGSGTNYPAGQFTIPLAGGAGSGATVTTTIQPFIGTITNKGSGYTPASTQVETITAFTGSGVGGTATIVFYGIENGTITPGSGYTNYQYNSIPAQGGSGSGANLNIVVTGGQVTSVTVANHGTGYNQGDELFVNNSDLVWVDQQAGTSGTSGGSGFKYTLTQLPGSVKSFTPIINPWSGSGYAVGDVVTFTDNVGSGSNFRYTISNVGVVSASTLGEGGSGYNIGDILTSTYDVDFDLPQAGTTRSNFITGAFTYETINVTVAAGVINPGGNRYFLNGTEIADLTLKRNTVYNFVFPNADAYSAHPLKFSTTPDGTHGGGVQYTTNVRDYYNGSGLVQGIQLIVADTTPNTLYYYCTIHPDMPGTAGNEGTLTITGTFQSGYSVTVDQLERDDKITLRNDGSALFTGPIEATIITSGSNIIGTDLLIRQSTGVGGNAEIEGNLTVEGDTIIKGNLTVEGATEFSATVGGAGEVSIGDVDEDTVNIKGDLIVNGTFTAPVPPATLGQLTGAQFYIDQANEKIGFFNHEPQYEVDISGVLHNTQDVWLSSTSGNVSIGRDPETYTAVAKLDINGDVLISDTLTVDEGTFDAPSIKFGSDNDLGLYTYTIGSDNGLGITNKSGKVAGFNKGEIEFFRNLDFIYQKIDTFDITNTGENYAIGNYTNIALTGGSGSGLLADITVGFTTTITNPGAGYTPQTYENVPITSITSAPAGALQKFTITSGGTDYANGTYTNVPLNGGTGTNGTANITVSGGVITQIIPNQVGSGYSVGNSLTVNTADLGGSLLGTLSISNAGSNYTDGTYLGVPLITSSGTGSGATANITVSGGIVSDVTVSNRGNNYSLSSSLTVNGDAITEAKLGTLTIDSAGVGYANGTYTNVPLIYSSIRPGVLGAGATANITVSGNTITNVTVNNQGANYLVNDQLTVNSSNVGGTGAGRISTLTISSPGSALTDGTLTNVALTGGGTGATVNGNITGGQLTSVTISNPGTGYQQGQTLGLTGYPGVSLTVASLVNPSGLVLEVATINTGSGLVLTPATLITGSGAQLTVSQIASGTGGSGALATVTVNSFGQVSEVIIIDAGSGYSIGDTLRVSNSDMNYTDVGGGLIASAIPTTQMLLTVSSNGNITVLDITDFGEGYLVDDILSVSNTNLGNQGSGFEVEIVNIISETTVSIDEKEGSISVKQLDAEEFTIDNSLTLTGNGIAKTTSGDLQLNPFSTSAVKIGGSNGLVVPIGTTSNRPIGQLGMIRYNSQENQFEGFNGISFVSLGGVRDVDLNTYITAELVTGENDDTFRFYNGGIQTISLTDSLYRISNVTNFEYVNLNNVTIWEEGLTVTSPYDDNDFNPTTNVNTTSNVITITSHNLTQGVRVTYKNNGGVDIGGLNNNGTYYVNVINQNTIRLAETLVNLNSGIYVDLTTTSSDPTHTLTPIDPVDILYYYGTNVYAIKSSGTFAALSSEYPDHITGTEVNGTVDLEWVRSIFSSPNFYANNYQFTGNSINFNNSTFKFTGSTSSSSNIISASPELKLQFNVSNTDRTFVKFKNSGSIEINNSYGSGENYIEVLDYELKKFTLKDTQVLSAEASIDTSVGNSVNLIMVPYDNTNSLLLGHSGKVMIEIIDDSTTPRRQYSELSFLISSDSASVYYTETSKLYTDVVLCDVSVDVDTSGNVILNVQDETGSSTVTYSIKAVTNTILA